MKSLIFAALASATLDCKVLTVESMPESLWYRSLCAQLDNEYLDVRLTPIKSFVIGNKNESKDHFDSVKIVSFKAGRLKVLINEKAENGSVNEVAYLFKVDAYKNVWVLKRPVDAGKVLQEKDVSTLTVNVAPFVGIKEFVEESPVGKALKTGQKRESILFLDSLASPGLIIIGEKLTAKIIDGNMIIETPVMALENGEKEGQTIKVRLIATGAIFQATIEGKKNVKVDI